MNFEPRLTGQETIAEAVAQYAQLEQYQRAYKVWQAGVRESDHKLAYRTGKAQRLGQALREEIGAITR